MASPQLQTIVQTLRARPRPENPTFQEIRAGFEQLAALFPVATDVQLERVDANGVPAEWVTAPGASADHAVLYLHGGGYVIGSINTHRDLAARISRASGSRALVIDYRLAPEHPFPAAVDDAVTAYRWLLTQGVSPSRIAIGGDSAGGGLTVATLVAIRDAGLPLPAAGVCISPWVDMEATGESITTRADVDPMLERPFLLQAAEAYLHGADPRSPLATPLYAGLSGLPPLLIHVGDHEALLDDSTRLAERAKAAGVDVTLEVWDEMIHVWHLFAAILPEGQQAIDRIGEWVRDKIGSPAITAAAAT